MQFTLQSKDVLHDFWVPAFRMKKDAVPGIDVTYTVTPNRLGTYPIVCAELCGLGHAVDALDAHVVEPRPTSTPGCQARPAGREARGGGGGGGGGGAATDGKAIFASRRTAARCHTLADAGTNGTIGPDLDDVLADKDEAFIKHVDRGPERRDRRRLPGRDHAAELRQTPGGPQARRAREVPF